MPSGKLTRPLQASLDSQSLHQGSGLSAEEARPHLAAGLLSVHLITHRRTPELVHLAPSPRRVLVVHLEGVAYLVLSLHQRLVPPLLLVCHPEP